MTLRLLRAEWTKFWTVRATVAATAVAPLLIVAVALLAGAGSAQTGALPVPIGPRGGPVTDAFYFLHRPLTGDGSITVNVTSLKSRIPDAPSDLRTGTVPWAKAGLILRDSTRQGSPYTAIMVTGSHGVRMQADYVDDTAGSATARWLRLVRHGATITGYESADGTRWTKVATVPAADLGRTVQGGLFVASPPAVDGIGTRSSVSTAEFEQLGIQGGWAARGWAGEQVGAASPGFAGYPPTTAGAFQETGSGWEVTGAGDIAPAVRESLATAGTLKDLLTGTFAALITVIVVGTLFATTEYRDDLMSVTLAAVPGRGGVLAAKALVLGTVTFMAGLVGTLVAIPLGERLARANGVYLFPTALSTDLRVAVGTAALLATAAILALAAGVILRRGAEAVTTVIVAIVLPCFLVGIPFLPGSLSDWLTRVTPAAGFAVQQTLMRYPQVDSIYTPYTGYYPLSPWEGLAVLAGYALVSLLVAASLLRRRDV